jgi:hypothetical protein
MFKVLFLCTENACRSQMAEGLVNRVPGGPRHGWDKSRVHHYEVRRSASVIFLFRHIPSLPIACDEFNSDAEGFFP